MRRIITYIALALMINLMLFNFNGTTVAAQSIKDLEEEMNRVEAEQIKLKQEQSDLNNEGVKTKQKMNSNLSEQDSVYNEIYLIDAKVSNTEQQLAAKETEISIVTEEINQLQSSITALGEEIEVLNSEIEELHKKIAKREILLENRLRSIQKSGGQTKYIEVILGSSSFVDFVSRSLTVSTIMNQDKSILEQHAQDQEMLESKVTEVKEKKVTVEVKKTEVEANKVALETQKNELVGLKKQLKAQIATKEVLIASLKEEHAELEEYNLSVEDEQKIIAAQSTALQKAKQIAQSQKTELEQLAKVQAENERKAREQAAKEQAERDKAKENQNNNNNTNSGTTNKPTPTPTPNPNVSSGNAIFAMPTTGRLTSPYGYRTHPIFGISKLHAGMDIANSPGTAVNAAASGVVISAGWFGGYGNAVLIAHSINGKSYVTLYAHLSSISVSGGQVVGQHQMIGRMGTTGNSTGPHLHFEVHIGSFAASGANTVNPRDYMY